MKSTYPTGKFVIVRWVDSMKSGGWHDFKQCDLGCITAGILIEKTKDRVVIAMNRSHHGDGDFMEIPLCSVKSIKPLKE